MLELADIFREYGPAYLQKYGERMLPSHKQAMWDIEHCRTALMGGECYWCASCEEYVYSYHSCGNRHCPKCGGDRADTWRDKQLENLLPVPYFMVTCTLPHTLNPIARSNQTLIYDLLFKTSADALQTLAFNPKWVGGKIGMVGALHTWSHSMGYHLHVHYLVPAGGVDLETGEWKASHSKFLAPASALREVFRAKFRDALEEADPDLFANVPPETWSKNWVVHGKPVGNGQTALKYLAPYIYRVALSNRRLVKMEDRKVTFRYKPRKKPWTAMTLDVMTFMQRFLQHVLPKGFQKVRYFGFLHPGAKKTFTAIQEQFPSTQPDMEPESESESKSSLGLTQEPLTPSPIITETPICCPHCGGPLAYISRLSPHKAERGPP